MIISYPNSLKKCIAKLSNAILDASSIKVWCSFIFFRST